MQYLRTRRNLNAWIAVVVLVLASLAPAFSGMSGSQAKSWVEVCTGQGAQWVQAEAGTPGSSGSSHQIPHCPACATHLFALELPEVSHVEPLLITFAEAFQAAFLQGPRIQHPWAPAQQRGPPQFS